MTHRMPLSFSRLNVFEQCPARFDYQYVSKRVKDSQNEASSYGDRVHKTLETLGNTLAVATDTSDPGVVVEAVTNLAEGNPETEQTLKTWAPLVVNIAKRPGKKLYEHQMTINENLQPTSWFGSDVWIRSIADVLVVDGPNAVCLDWKGLPLDTPLPTPTGWATMGNIRVGDTVFAESGEQCRVVGKSAVKNLRCLEVEFDDTSRVTCDVEHRWKLHDGCVVPVTALRPRDKVLVAGSLALPDAALPIDPYVLGLWLADGKHSSGEISKPDAFVWEEIQRRGYEVDMKTGGATACPTRTVKKLRRQLIDAGVLRNKHIPAAYLRAGYAQRLSLLHGLMDGDGSANPHRKQAIYSTTDSALSDQVVELLLSLGQRPLKSTTQQFGFGLHVTAYPISFRPVGINPFLMPRKRDRISPTWGAGKSGVRRVVAVREVPSVPTQCIGVDSKDNTYLCTRKMIPTHNSGKVKADYTQLQLFAAMTMWHYPEVQTVKTGYVWLKYNEVTNAVYKRQYLDALWGGLRPRFDAVQQAIDLGVFPTKPSGLCPWCPAKDICPDARQPRKR
jgi:hypothetical protein